MLLKIKAFIYQKTGIYLAKKEEDEHINSIEISLEIARILALEDDLNEETVRSIMIGTWQCKNGFYREFKRPSLYNKFRGKK